MTNLLEWITENGYVTNKDKKWYNPSEFPRVYLDNEQLIELYYELSNIGMLFRSIIYGNKKNKSSSSY